MRLSKRQIADLRAECGKGGLDAALLAAQLLEMVEKLQASLEASEELVASARRDLAKLQGALEEARGGCPRCRAAAAAAAPEQPIRPHL